LVAYGGPFGENYFYAKEEVHGDPKLRRFMPEESIDARTRRRPRWFLEEEHVFTKHAEFVKKMVEDSARVAVGSHGQLQGLGYHWELWAMASAGLSNHDALRVATIYGAEAIGLDRDLGSVEPGKLADILVFDADPLENLRNTVRLEYVMKNGRLYRAETLDEVWPRERPLATPYWRQLVPEGVRAGMR
jgi:imidazolonepropionase-like amidohydrolase